MASVCTNKTKLRKETFMKTLFRNTAFMIAFLFCAVMSDYAQTSTANYGELLSIS